MDAGLELYIKEGFHSSKADLLFESFEIFEEANIEGHENDFIGLLMEESNIDKSNLAPMFQDMAIDLLFSILMDYGIKLKEDTPHSFLNSVCKGLDSIQYYIDADGITMIVESDLDIEEKFADILSAVIDLDKDLLFVYLEEVNVSLIDKIEELFNNRIMVPTIDIETQASLFKIKTKIKDFLRFLGNDDLIGVKLLNAGVLVGAPFEQYMRYFEHKLDEMVNDQAAKELMILLYMSLDGSQALSIVYQKYSSVLFHDLDKISKVFSQMNKLTLEFDRYMLQRSLSLTDKNQEQPK